MSHLANRDSYFQPKHVISNKEILRLQLEADIAQYQGEVTVLPPPTFAPRPKPKKLMSVWEYCDCAMPSRNKTTKRYNSPAGQPEGSITKPEAMEICGYSVGSHVEREKFMREGPKYIAMQKFRNNRTSYFYDPKTCHEWANEHRR